jgi:hypothetical protein
VRRFIARVGADRLDDVLALRDADNVASGISPAAGYTTHLRERIDAQRRAPVHTHQLAIDGDDLQRELGLAPGPLIGRTLARLMEAVIDDPSRNERDALLEIARETTAPPDAGR